MKQVILKKSVLGIFILSVAMLMTNCKSSEKMKDVTVYCSGEQYRSSEGFIRANSIGESNDMVMSRKVAKSNTLEELASKIEVTVKAVIDNYYNRRQKNMDESIEKRYEELIRQVVNQKINGYKTICEKMVETPEKKYRTFLAYELPVDNILSDVYNNISKDQELKIDYDYEKFKKTFEEEMKKMSNE